MVCTNKLRTTLGPGSTETPGPTSAKVTFGSGADASTATYLLADDDAERARGLSGLTSVEGGMLFTYAQPTETDFWMKDTLVPLDIAFIAKKGSASAGAIISVVSMEPCTADPCKRYNPQAPYIAAIEVPKGGFDPSIRRGTHVSWHIIEGD